MPVEFNCVEKENLLDIFDTYWKYAYAPGSNFSSSLKSGKWRIRVKPCKVNETWHKVKMACLEGKFITAKVATARTVKARGDDNYLICIYTDDYEDLDNLRQVRDALREIGFIEAVKYKKDIDTMNGVFGDGEFLPQLEVAVL